MTWHFRAPEQGELLKQRTSLTPLPRLSPGEGRKAGCVGTTSLLLAFSVFLAPPPPSPSIRFSMVLTCSQAGSRQGGAARPVVSDHRQGSIGEKSQTDDRNLHFEHVCFCVVEPEIPYLLMESLIIFFLSLLLYFVGLGKITLF